MSEMKTTRTDSSVRDFLDGIPNDAVRQDCETLCRLMEEVTGERPVMWGKGIVGFDTYHYRYASGREGDWFVVGFAPRKQNLTVYLMDGFEGREGLLERLGPHSTGQSCLYIKRLADADLEVLRDLISRSVRATRDQWG